MIFRICFLISLFWTQINPAFAKKPPLDSLLSISSSQSGLDRLVTQNLIVRHYDLDDGGTLALCDSIFKEADRLGEYLQGIDAQLTKGHIYYEMRAFDLAMETYKKIKDYTVKHQVEEKYYDTYGAIIGVFEVWNQPDSAMFYSKYNLKYWAQHDTVEYVYALNRLSYHYGMYEFPLKKYDIQKRLLSIGRIRNDSSVIAAAYTQIACLLGNQLDDAGAEEFYQKAIYFNELTGNKSQMIIALCNYGIFVKKRGDYRKADSLQRAALQQIDNSLSDWNQSYFRCHIHHNLASLYRVQGIWDSTIVQGRKSLIFADNGYHVKVMAGTKAEMLFAFAELGLLDSAQVYKDALFQLISRKTNPKQYKVGLEGSVRLLEKQSKFQEALEAYKGFTKLQDSLNSVVQGQQLEFKTATFKMKEKDLDIDKLTFEKNRSNAFRNLFLILLLAFIVVATSLIYTYYFRARKNKQLLINSQEIEQLKSRFFANISHELRTPLTLILGPTESLLSRAKPEDKGLLLLIKTHSLRLKKLVNQVLELTKIEAGKLKLQVAQQNVLPYLNGWVYSFKSQAEDKNIKLTVRSKEDSLPFFFQRDYLEHIINNLVHNAIKFSSQGGSIDVSAGYSPDTKEVLIEIQDNGIGISQEDLPYIFDRFYQVKNAASPLYEGTGIGLALTKELVELHGGEIQVKSKHELGTTFFLRFPTGSENFSPDQIINLSDKASPDFTAGEEIYQNDPEEDSGVPIILIVEDQDEVRAYLSSELSRSFRIITASNGAEGVEIAKNQVPDLILSDLMMPVMGGLEFAGIMKNDPATDHIPFVMLTARGETADIIEALETKVDSYLTKPFNPAELTLRINNLIQLKQNIREKYAAAGEEIIQEPGYSPKEVQFLAAIDTVLEDNLVNEQLDVNLLADAIHLSRSQLFRKLRSITGESPSGYIRKFRLEKARNLLQNEYVTVAEVSFLVGFNSPSYFSKCFSDQFGTSPGMYTRSKIK